MSLGNWKVEGTFNDAVPYPHVIIDNFFDESTFEELLREFGSPECDEGWIRYWNPIEKKYALNDFNEKPFTLSVFNLLQSQEFVEKVISLTGITSLHSDPHLHGAGLHYHPSGGKLDMHLDYSIHPVSGMERRVNLIVYLNETWDESWGGSLELWDDKFTHRVKSVYPLRNRAILFRTSDISYHGIPHPIKCPQTMGRKSLAVYYVSPIVNKDIRLRSKAEFRALPNQPVDDRLARLYEIRKTRWIKPDDLWTSWESDGGSFW